MILFGQMGVLGLIYYLREERLYPSARRFMTHQKLKDVLRPALDKIIFKVIVISNSYELLSANLSCIYLFLSQTQNNRLNVSY